MRSNLRLLWTLLGLGLATGCTPQITGWRSSPHPHADIRKERIASLIERYRAIRKEIEQLERLQDAPTRRPVGELASPQQLPEIPQSLPVREFFYIDSELEPSTSNRFRYSFREDPLTRKQTHLLDVVLFESEVPERPNLAERVIQDGEFAHFAQLMSIRSDETGAVRLSLNRRVHRENGLFAATKDTQLTWRTASGSLANREALLCSVGPADRSRFEVGLFDCSQGELVDLIQSKIVRFKGTHGEFDWEPTVADQQAVLWFLLHKVPGGEATVAAARAARAG